MFALVQFPLADLRPLIPGELGRLSRPDWRADDAGGGFVRGFGKVATRNAGGYQLAGERRFADFNQAARLKSTLQYGQPEWDRLLQAELRFRRLYFDGGMVGRFEFGFLIRDEDEDLVRTDEDPFSYEPDRVAAALLRLGVVVRSPDGREMDTSIEGCGPALGMAYVVATTGQAEMARFPPAETYGKAVIVGTPLVHLRVSCGRQVRLGRDSHPVTDELFVTSGRRSASRNNVLVQTSSEGASRETARERAVRVLFSHLNALLHAQSHFVAVGEELGIGGRSTLSTVVDGLLDRLGNFSPTGPATEGDEDFARAIRAFSAAYVGRKEEMVGRLQELMTRLKQPTAGRVALDAVTHYLQGLVDLVTKTAVEAGVKRFSGGG
jgi:hypothetical protein